MSKNKVENNCLVEQYYRMHEKCAANFLGKNCSLIWITNGDEEHADCIVRISERNRKGEEAIPADYLKKLYEQHKQYFEACPFESKVKIPRPS